MENLNNSPFFQPPPIEVIGPTPEETQAEIDKLQIEFDKLTVEEQRGEPGLAIWREQNQYRQLQYHHRKLTRYQSLPDISVQPSEIIYEEERPLPEQKEEEPQ